MALVNTAKPTTTLANTAKASGAELWSTITTTWANETRTWLDCVSLMDNVLKTSYGDPLWSFLVLPWQLSTPWIVNTSVMSNQAKP